jgi:hypothetical protein
MKQTAVEWLENELVNSNLKMPLVAGLKVFGLIKKAKEMEKKQLCYFYIKGAEAEMNNPYVTNIEFYKKTFKTTEK